VGAGTQYLLDKESDDKYLPFFLVKGCLPLPRQEFSYLGKELSLLCLRLAGASDFFRGVQGLSVSGGVLQVGNYSRGKYRKLK